MPKQLTHFDLQRGMRLSLLDGVLTQAFYGLTWPGGVFVTGLALALGASNLVVGLLAAMPPLLSGINLIAARQLEALGTRRAYFVVTSSIHRAVFLLLLALPFALAYLSSSAQLGLLVAIIFVSTVLGGCQHTAWMSWMADMVPEDRRGAFFSRRNMVCGAAWMIEAYAVGKLLTRYNTVTAYVLVFAAATVVALTSVPVVAAQPEPPLAVSETRRSLLTLWKDAWATPSFRNFLFFQLLWGFTTNMAGPFYNVYMLKNLGLGVGTITIWGILWSLVGTITLPYWGMLGDRAGNKPTMLFALIGSCANAAGWLFVTPANAHWLLVTLFCLGGFFDTGAGLVGFNMLFGVLPQKNKPSYLALNDTVVGAMIGIAPLVGGLLAEKLPSLSLPFSTHDALYVLIAMSTVLRVFPLVFIAAMPELRGQGIGFMMREFVLANPFRLFPNLYLGGKSAAAKLNAIGTLSDMRSKAALPELIKSMRDHNPRVRQKAVMALGEIGDPHALDPLIEALDDPRQDIQGEAALALGRLGDPRAMAPLVDKLSSPDLHLQRCAVTALGDLRARQAVDTLIELMRTTHNNGVMIACADALGRIGEFRSVEPLLDITRLTRNLPVKHSLVAAAGLLVDREGELYKALAEPEGHAPRAARQILSSRTVRLAREPRSGLTPGLEHALACFEKGNHNDAILEMKVANQVTVREYLSNSDLRNALGFEPWVKLLDSSYGTQLEALNTIDRNVGIALAVVDYYARHCPNPAEPDMDIQEFLLALYAFRSAQTGLSRMLFGRTALLEQVQQRFDGLSQMLLDLQ